MTGRRSVLAMGAGLVVAGAAKAKVVEAQIGPAEDLMREHGVLRRVLFLYDEAAHRLEAGQKAPLDAVSAAASIIRKVIERYHEKLEEKHVFPRLEKAGRLIELTTTLRKQHQAGAAVTASIVKLCDGSDAKTLAERLRAFNRMYRPHAAREDTVLFPAFHTLVGENAYRELGEQFEAEETKQLGHEGFEHAVEQVEKLEAQFGFADLGQFTPKT